MYKKDTIRKHVSSLANHIINDTDASIGDPSENNWFECDCCGKYYAPWNYETKDKPFYSASYTWSQYYLTPHQWGNGVSRHDRTEVCRECHEKIQNKVAYRTTIGRVREYKRIMKEFKESLKRVRRFR